ncbi:hypothetical protein WOLCODRAFT_140835 [Wolfiporia cocos MD-104 SS10]|uniref:Uncharacterized protein n=1 Tax=Wolfiporia cocos (strain MD-104) TaxID=742152 RepID=A0A2H3J581_WOLCO|nr:hypothetical protein WOLCODRAFT_140835 [Wolfiporia cocos MD-104 SS10]
MMFARGAVATPAKPPSSTTAITLVNKSAVVAPPAVQPKTTSEQYWAARALTAETLLTARLAHENELSALSAAEEEKRARELAVLQRSHDKRYAKLEILAMTLFACLIAFVSTTIYLLSRAQRPTPSRWALPSHFTIPILSPFASVVEHETSVIDTRLITMCCAILAALAYACFRYWLAHGRQR